MSKKKQKIALIDAIYDAFPEVAVDLDRTLKYWRYEPHERHKIWPDLIERFSQLTTDAISRGEENIAIKYLSFIQQEYNSGGEEVKKAIDVYYVESLLWNIKDNKRKKWGWSLIPSELKTLYVKIWGEPKFDK